MAASCYTVEFRPPYPIGATSIEKTPKALIGEYINPFNGDTIKIEKGNTSDGLRQISNGNEVLLEKWYDFYVINISDGNGFYPVLLVTPIKGGHLKLMGINGEIAFDIDSYKNEKLHSKSALALSMGIFHQYELCSCLCDNNTVYLSDCYVPNPGRSQYISKEDLEQIKFECEDFLNGLTNDQFKELFQSKVFSLILENINNSKSF